MGRESRRNKSGERALAQMRQSPGYYLAPADQSIESMLRTAAIHEAGHAIAAIVLGMDVAFIILHDRIVGTQRRIGGYCETQFEGKGTAEDTIAAYTSPEMLRVRAIEKLAGPAAEWLAQQSATDAEGVDRGAEDDDREAIRLAIQAVGRDDYFAYFQSCDDEAHRLIREHWSACCTVAECLLARPNQRIPGEFVEQAVKQTNTP